MRLSRASSSELRDVALGRSASAQRPCVRGGAFAHLGGLDLDDVVGAFGGALAGQVCRLAQGFARRAILMLL